MPLLALRLTAAAVYCLRNLIRSGYYLKFVSWKRPLSKLPYLTPSMESTSLHAILLYILYYTAYKFTYDKT